MLCYSWQVPRPRVHDLDHVLDAAEQMAVTGGPASVTIRALSVATSASNGALYNAFGSRAGLLGRAWIRAAERFLALQHEVVEQVLASSTPSEEAVVAAALCPAVFLEQSPASARFLLTVSRDELLGSGEIPAEVADELHRLDQSLVALFILLARSLWDRKDAHAVALVRLCVVDLPTALLLNERSHADSHARERLASAVRAVLTIPPADYREPQARKGISNHDTDTALPRQYRGPSPR